MTVSQDGRSAGEPSPWYYLTLSLGAAGLAFLAMAAWASWRTTHGRDPVDGIGNSGAVGLAIGFCILYAERGTRWQKLPVSLRTFIAQAIVVTLSLSVLATAYQIYSSFFGPVLNCSGKPCDTSLQHDFIILDVLCCAGTLTWLLIFRPRR